MSIDTQHENEKKMGIRIGYMLNRSSLILKKYLSNQIRKKSNQIRKKNVWFSKETSVGFMVGAVVPRARTKLQNKKMIM